MEITGVYPHLTTGQGVFGWRRVRAGGEKMTSPKNPPVQGLFLGNNGVLLIIGDSLRIKEDTSLPKNSRSAKRNDFSVPEIVIWCFYQPTVMSQSKEYSILYVDDEPANLRSFKSAFRRLYKVHIADHPMKGIEIVKSNELNIVVSDHRMPDLVGTDFLREVYQFNQDIKRIILSGFVKQNELEEANEEFGIHAFITKPWDFENVQAIFERLLSEKDSPKMTYE